jgi:transglutaminase-like putative cysteine protease
MQTPALKFCILAALVPASLSFQSFAQAPAPDAAPAAAYADEPLVIERSETVVDVAADGTGWKQRTLVARLQADAGVKRYSVLTIPYAGNSQHVEIAYARVTHADGTVVETPATEAMDMPAAVTRAAPFYSDLKELQLPVRSLRVGDRLELQYRIVRTRAETPGEFWGQESFSETAVALEQTLELRLPAGMVVQVWSPTIKPAESSAAGDGAAPAQHIYRWSAPQLKPTVGKEAEAALAAQKKVLWTPEQELDAEQGRLPTVAWTTFKSWEEVGVWYRGLEADRIVADDTVKAKVAELTAGKSTDEDKARALYAYVATNIRYIGVAFGIGRYQPHAAAEILSNQYGDCKDKHTLLAAMLAAAGIQSDAVLIGAGVRFNQAVPSPASFNHLITRVTLGGKPVFLDTTAEVAPWSMLVLATRDRQALVVPTSGAATIVRTPVDPPFPAVEAFDSVGSLGADGVSTSRLSITFGGDGEIAARAAFRQIPPDKYDAIVQVFAKAIGFQGTTSNPEVTRPTDMTQPFKLSFDYKREKAGDWEHLRTIPEVVPAVFPRVTEMEPPVRAVQLGSVGTETSTSAMKLPEGWNAILPPSVHAKCDYATYDMTYRLENGTLYADRKIVVLAKKVPVSDWRVYKAFVDMVNPGKERYIQLVTAAAPKPPEERTEQIEDALNSSDPMLKNNVAYALANSKTHLSDAQTLAEQAVQLQEEAASKQVSMKDKDKVKSFDQMQILGTDWETLGWVYYRQGQLEKAETYMHAAWELKPRNVDINLYLGIIYDAQHKPNDATTFYRMALSGTSSSTIQNSIQARFDRLGITTNAPLPMDVTTPLPSLTLQLNPADIEPMVDILLTRDKLPAVTLLQGDSALEKRLATAIQSALVNPFPDTGPEKLLRRARVTCSSSDTPACALHFLGSQVASEESANQHH